MKIDLSHVILAIVTGESDECAVSGGAPVFCIRNEEERKRIASELGILTLSNVHDLGNGTYVIIKH